MEGEANLKKPCDVPPLVGEWNIKHYEGGIAVLANEEISQRKKYRDGMYTPNLFESLST